MTLSIIDSMLRGDLRRQILSMLKTEKEISLLWNNLRKATAKKDLNLREIEDALVAAVEKSRLVQVSADYMDDREMRQGAEEARKKSMYVDNDNYTNVYEMISLDGVFEAIPETTPTDKFLHLLVKIECKHAIVSLMMLVKSVHDDGVFRTYIRKLFTAITSLCKDADELYIKESLTQLYFELYHTFRSVLEKSEHQQYETDFENFVYTWKGEFPDEKVIARYNEIIESFVPVENNGVSPADSYSPVQAPIVNQKPKDKIDRFLDAARAFTFEEMPKVKELGTPQRIRKLVDCLLQEKGTDAETYGHTAAMLVFLGFYKWIRDNHVSGYKLTQFDIWCTENIMNKGKGSSAFKHYRLSVNADPQHDSYRFLGWQYKKTVEEEYNKILQGK